MHINKIFLLCSLSAIMAVLPSADSFAVTKKASKQSAIQMGTKVRTKVEVSGLYDQECYDAYYGCMDAFCIADNESGGSCTCSDLNAKYENELLEIKKILDKAEHVKTVEVEKVQAGANADIIFAGERKYDEDGNIIDVDELSEEDKKKQKRESLMAMFETSYDEDVFDDEEVDVSDLVGESLYQAAEELCHQQIPEKCEKDIAFLTQVYKRQITSDCKGFENSISQKRAEAEATLASAEADVRSALKDSLNEANKYDLGTCMVEFKKCMMTEDACGKDWSNCVSTIADANMQGIDESATAFKKDNMSSAATKAFDGSAYGIAASTMEGLDSKRIICERVLNQCVMVRDQVWPAFLREAAPTIKLAELNAESKMRQSCLTDISNCIHKACKDDIAGKGVDTMDACLARPDMARSFCKIEIDRCEKMESQIWAYVTDKLKAMRVDACTEEVKACFTADTRCGANFQNCIGMDYEYIHDICPIDSLVVCKQDNPDFSMDDLDSMLMGLYLNIDNSALDTCQALVDSKMTEICGSTTDCNRFAADEVMGTGSLRSVKDGNVYRITGMISFGSIKTGDGLSVVKDGEEKLGAGEVGVEEYLTKVKEFNVDNPNVPNAAGIVATIEEELKNIAGTINRTIQLIEQDPEIQFCVSGRDLSQITGKSGEKTTARFPNLLNSVKMQIAASALRKAQDNYNKKFTEEVTKATKDASLDVAQYMCQMLPSNNGVTVGAVSSTGTTDLVPPYAISYEVGTGLDNSLLVQGGHGSSSLSSGGVIDATAGASKASDIISSFTGMGSHKVKIDSGTGSREMWSTFNRETRVCHFCTATVTKNCKSVSKKGFLGIGAKNEQDCTESEPVENCHDIQM